MKRLWLCVALVLTVLFVQTIGVEQFGLPTTQLVQADGFIDFEDGIDSQNIQSSIPGLQFTTTEGYDWIYGDWRTGEYNGPYPQGPYYSNGNIFAWLGPNQGAGRIDFTEGCASYLQVYVSSLYGLTADAYYSDGSLAATASVNPNLDTGQMERLRVDAPPGDCFHYVLLHDTGNYWLIDDLSTDAAGVPATRPPVIFLPGLMGTRLDVYNPCEGETASDAVEVWPSVRQMLSPNDKHLEKLRLAENGQDPANDCYQVLTSHVTNTHFENGAIRLVGTTSIAYQFYGPLFDHLRQQGFLLYPYGFDWRLDLETTADQPGPNNDLDDFIDSVLAETGSDQVNIVAHSLGGLLARQYITATPEHAAKVEQVISLGTPYLGAPKSLAALRHGESGLELAWGLLGLNRDRAKELTQNSPAMYQILPTQNYFNVQGGYYRFNGDLQTWAETQSLLTKDHNAVLTTEAENFHATAMDDWGSYPVNVPYRLIVGSGMSNTPGVLHEQVRTTWYGRQYSTWDLENINGDGTVPIHSADLRGRGFNYSGGAATWYTNELDHRKLALEPYILDFVGAILATPPTAAVHSKEKSRPPDPDATPLYSGPLDRFPLVNAKESTPPVPPEMGTTPFIVNGQQIAAFGDVSIHIYDQNGNHTGYVAEDQFELGIPNSSYTDLGDSVFITVPHEGTYTVLIDSTGSEDFDFRVRNLQGLETNLVQRTITYSDASIGSQGQARLVYSLEQNEPAPDLEIDHNGDGTFDASVPPTGDLGPTESADVDGPSITVDLDGQIGSNGWYIGNVAVTINAADNGSGLAKVDYSVDFGRNIQSYTGQFTVDAAQTSLLIVKATDRAGNETWESVSIGPQRTYLVLTTTD